MPVFSSEGGLTAVARRPRDSEGAEPEKACQSKRNPSDRAPTPAMAVVAIAIVSVIAGFLVSAPPRFLRHNWADTYRQAVVIINATTMTGMGPSTTLGAGSLVAIGKDNAYIVTVNHVAPPGASKILVTLSNGNQTLGKVVGGMPNVDVSVVSIPASEAAGLPVLKLGNSDELKPGERLTVIGHPFFLYYSVSTGVVSAIHREVPSLGYTVQDFVQTDAAVNGGNSGGPVIDDATHEIIALADAIVPRPNTYPDPEHESLYNGLAVLVSSRLVEKVYNDVRLWRTVIPGVSHIEVRDHVTRVLMDDPHVPRISHGAEIVSVQEGSAAARIGIARGDIITSVNGTNVPDGNGFRVLEFLSRPGDLEKVTVLRGRQLLNFEFPMGGDVMPKS
jgi:serine protease Do